MEKTIPYTKAIYVSSLPDQECWGRKGKSPALNSDELVYEDQLVHWNLQSSLRTRLLPEPVR